MEELAESGSVHKGAEEEKEEESVVKNAREEEVRKRRGRPANVKPGAKGEEKGLGSMRKFVEVQLEKKTERGATDEDGEEGK